jgi:hypothetical protein
MDVPPSFCNEWRGVGEAESLVVRLHTRLWTKTLDTITLWNETIMSIFHCNIATLLRVACEGGLRSDLYSRFAVTFCSANVQYNFAWTKQARYIFSCVLYPSLVCPYYASKTIFWLVLCILLVSSMQVRVVFLPSSPLRRVFGTREIPTISSYACFFFF